MYFLSLDVVSEVQTNLVALNQGHGSKDTRMAIELRLVIHGHNRRHQCSGDKHTLAHRRQMEESAIIEEQLGIAKLVSCRRASNRNFVDVLRTLVFSIGCRPHSCQSQIFALIMSMYLAVRTFKTRWVRRVRPNLRQGN